MKGSELKTFVITEGVVTVKGKSSNGDDIVVTADIEKMWVEVIKDIPDTFYLNQRKPISIIQETRFHMKVKDEWTLRLPSRQPVKRTARVLGWEDSEACERTLPTVARIKAAAEIAGVDENTDFTLWYERDSKRSMNVVYVEFEWTD